MINRILIFSFVILCGCMGKSHPPAKDVSDLAQRIANEFPEYQLVLRDGEDILWSPSPGSSFRMHIPFTEIRSRYQCFAYSLEERDSIQGGDGVYYHNNILLNFYKFEESTDANELFIAYESDRRLGHLLCVDSLVLAISFYAFGREEEILHSQKIERVFHNSISGRNFYRRDL